MPNVFDLYAGHPRQDFWLIPEIWARYDHTRNLNWTRVEFKSDNATLVPERPGVYAFVVQHHVGKDLPGSFPMYVGKAGTSIRDRYRSYQGQAFRGRPGRATLDRLFGLWKVHLAFYYLVDLGGDTPIDMERTLINTVMPPLNDRDFSADVRRLVKAFP